MKPRNRLNTPHGQLSYEKPRSPKLSCCYRTSTNAPQQKFIVSSMVSLNELDNSRGQCLLEKFDASADRHGHLHKFAELLVEEFPHYNAQNSLPKM